MDNYFNSKKYIILLVVVCVLFAILIIKFFDYLPQPDNIPPSGYSTQETSINDDNNAVNDPSDNEEADNEEEDEEEDTSDDDDNIDDNHKTGHIDFERKSYPDVNNFEEIPAPKGSNEEIIQTYDTN